MLRSSRILYCQSLKENVEMKIRLFDIFLNVAKSLQFDKTLAFLFGVLCGEVQGRSVHIYCVDIYCVLSDSYTVCFIWNVLVNVAKKETVTVDYIT